MVVLTFCMYQSSTHLLMLIAQVGDQGSRGVGQGLCCNINCLVFVCCVRVLHMVSEDRTKATGQIKQSNRLLTYRVVCVMQHSVETVGVNKRLPQPSELILPRVCVELREKIETISRARPRW